jgi:hypothetical protein
MEEENVAEYENWVDRPEEDNLVEVNLEYCE